MKRLCQTLSSRNRFMQFYEISGMYESPFVFNICHPFAITTSPRNPFMPGCVVALASSVSFVLSHSGFSKVRDSVICRIVVYVVNKLRWKRTVLVQPR